MGQQLTKIIQNQLLQSSESNNEKILHQLLNIVQQNLTEVKVQELSEKAAEIFATTKAQKSTNPGQLFHSLSVNESKQPLNPVLSIIESEIASITKKQSLICQTITQIMSTRKLYHIREQFRKLSLQILNLENAQFYVFHDSGRVEYHDFKENYITQLLEHDQKRKIIQHVLANAAEMIENVQISDNIVSKSHKEINNVSQGQSQLQTKTMKKVSFCQQSTLFKKLFNIPTNQSFYCSGQINKQSQKYSILSMFTYPSKSSSIPATHYLQLNPKIVQKLIKISMIEIEEETEYDIIKFYCKELLDILGLIIGENQGNIKALLKENSNEEGKKVETSIIIDDRLSLIETIKKLFAKNYQLLEQLLPLSLRYQQFRYQMLQRQRMYSKYLCEDNVLFMDFDEQGELFFLSNNRKNSQYQTLLYNLKMTDQLCIQKIFSLNVSLQQHIRKSLDDEVKNKKLYDLENGLKARVVRNQINQIERITVLIQDPPIILSHGTFSSSTLQGVSSSNKDQKKRKAGSTGSDSVSLGKGSKGSANLIKTLQKENPGITENGWLNLFIKDHELKRNNSTVMAKKKQTLFAKGQQGPNSTKTISQPLNFEEIEFLQQQDINSPDTNLLLFEHQYLQPFVKKVFTSIKYFSSLEYNKEHFDNFLFHLHQGYQLHENSFHNFVHGVNVMHTCFLICNIDGNAQILSPLKVFSTVLSGLCHDVGHTGRTNSFEIASRSQKALTYNDLSPLENFHVSYSFDILRRPENNFLQSLPLEEYNEIRKDMISNILYTDIKEHFPLIKKFKAIEYKPEQKPLSVEDLRTLTGMIIHTSDFGGSAKEFQICKEWSRRVNLEFSAQYKQEEELGIAQTPFFKDLQIESIMAKNEMGFLKVIVFPLYEALDDFYKDEGALNKLRVYAEKNIKEWEGVHISFEAISNEQKDGIKEEQKKQN